jgi:hypothetical protein
MPPSPRLRLAALLGLVPLLLPGAALSYPLDGFQSTGVYRLEVQRRVQIGQAKGNKRPAGELLPLDRVDLRLLGQRDLELPPPDPVLTAQVVKLLGGNADRYGIALLDLSDLTHLRYAEWNGELRQNPGSVGKLVVVLALFQGLADVYPDDVEARKKILRDTTIIADAFSVYDHHTVAKYDPATGILSHSPIHEGDRGSLWTYVDWMMSPSSNSAAGMIQKQLILLAHYGKSYPVAPEEESRFFAETPKSELSAIFARAIQEPVTRNGLDLSQLRQGSFFTHQGKVRVPGTSSYATPRELMKYLLRLEQGRLVDEWSSREIKRLLYITERRIRYASSGALRDAAVYFKSGSLYSCEPEPGFVCTKYHGNKRNYMNSTAIVEYPAGQNRLYYMTTVLSNVLRKNSAEDHRDLASAIQAKLLRDHPERPLAAGERPPALAFGEGLIGYQSERAELLLAVAAQEALSALGYDIGDIDGAAGSKTRSAVRSFQKSQGLPVSGAITQSLVDRLQKVAQARGVMRPDAAGTAPPSP